MISDIFYIFHVTYIKTDGGKCSLARQFIYLTRKYKSSRTCYIFVSQFSLPSFPIPAESVDGYRSSKTSARNGSALYLPQTESYSLISLTNGFRLSRRKLNFSITNFPLGLRRRNIFDARLWPERDISTRPPLSLSLSVSPSCFPSHRCVNYAT